MNKILHKNISETKEFASKLASKLKGGEVILLEGDLGAGKTHFTKFLGEALGVSENIKSPTFVFYQKYKGKNLNLYHFDFYRFLNEEVDVMNVGLSDALEDDKGVIVIEWANLINEETFKGFLRIKIESKGEERELEIEAIGEHYENFLK